ncbi:IS630 family transposase [Actinopolymorpha pittospori]|uniref:Transposase n=1 Tax=Actinopolymorpha pittospori TaxID=648752 RepID=A0A927RIA2_9ACTN|nr:transposase [Actinopolymorpha pittospori]MBE1605709.1 transposase [Actinopolymorpha pittospori]
MQQLTEERRSELESVVSVGYDGSESMRAQMVLAWFDGESAADIARRFGASKPTVYKWVDRFEEAGVAGLEDRTSTGRPRSVSDSVRSRIVALTKLGPPKETGLTHWSSYEMAKYLRRREGISVSHNFVAELWREHGLKPHRQGTFKTSTDPEFATKVVDVVGLYLDPPEGAVVLSFDEKTQVQALDRTQPLLPISFDKTEKRTHDYVRHGTTNLFAALEVLTGKITGQTFHRKRTKEFLRFMERLVKRYPAEQEIHVVLDNLKTHNNGDVNEWLAKHPNVKFHFTPKGSSWINQIETWFGIITRQSIRRGSFKSLAELIRHIENYIDHWNEDAEPFEWTATADQILEKVAMLDRDYVKLVANNYNPK